MTRLIKRLLIPPASDQRVCNYSNDYYGDQLCKTVSH